MEELLGKSRDGEKGLHVNMVKTKILVSGINLDVLKKSGKDPCGVCQTVGSTDAIFCGGCKRWVYKKCSCIKGHLHPDPKFRLAQYLGIAPAIDEREVTTRLSLETKSIKLSQISATLGTCLLQEVAVITRCNCALGKFR